MLYASINFSNLIIFESLSFSFWTIAKQFKKKNSMGEISAFIIYITNKILLTIKAQEILTPSFSTKYIYFSKLIQDLDVETIIVLINLDLLVERRFSSSKRC